MEQWKPRAESNGPEVIVEHPNTGHRDMFVGVKHHRAVIDVPEPPGPPIRGARPAPKPKEVESSVPNEAYRDYFSAETRSVLNSDGIAGRMKLEMEVGIELHPSSIEQRTLTAEVASFSLAVSLQDSRFADRSGLSDMRVHLTPQSFREVFQRVFPNQVDGSATWHTISSTLKSAHDLGITPFEYLETQAVEHERKAWAYLVVVLADTLAARYKEVILEQTRGNRHPLTLFPYQVFRDKFGFALIEMFSRFSEFDSEADTSVAANAPQFEARPPETGFVYDELDERIRTGVSDSVLYQRPRPETRYIEGYLLIAANILEDRNRGLILNGLQVMVMLNSLRRGLAVAEDDTAYAVSHGVLNWVGAFYDQFYGVSRIGQAEETARRIVEADVLFRQGVGIMAEYLVCNNADYRRFTPWQLSCEATRALAETGDYLWCNDTSGNRSGTVPRSTINPYFRPWYVAKPGDGIVGVLEGFSEFDIDHFVEVTGRTRVEILQALTRLSRGDDPVPTFDVFLLDTGATDDEDD